MNCKSRSLLLGTASLMICAFAAEVVGAGTAMAATESFTPTTTATLSYGAADTPWNGVTEYLEMPEFNSHLGSLTKVSIELTSVINSTGKLKNIGTGTATVSTYILSLTSYLVQNGTVVGTGLTPGQADVHQLLEVQPPALDFVVHGGAHPVSAIPIASGATYSFSAVNASAVGSSTYLSSTASAYIASFVGTGNAILPLVTNVNATQSVMGGNISYSETTTATDTAEVTYYYQPSSSEGVPEPTSMMLLGTGLTGLGWLSRRRRGDPRANSPSTRATANGGGFWRWRRRTSTG